MRKRRGRGVVGLRGIGGIFVLGYLGPGHPLWDIVPSPVCFRFYPKVSFIRVPSVSKGTLAVVYIIDALTTLKVDLLVPCQRKRW